MTGTNLQYYKNYDPEYSSASPSSTLADIQNNQLEDFRTTRPLIHPMTAQKLLSRLLY